MTHCICCVVKPTILNQNCDVVSTSVQNLKTSKQASLHAFSNQFTPTETAPGAHWMRLPATGNIFTWTYDNSLS